MRRRKHEDRVRLLEEASTTGWVAGGGPTDDELLRGLADVARTPEEHRESIIETDGLDGWEVWRAEWTKAYRRRVELRLKGLRR